METNNASSANDVGQNDVLSTQPRRGKATSSRTLLQHAVDAFGIARLAETLQIDVAQVKWLLASQWPMTLEQQRLLAVAVLVLSEKNVELRGRAAALLGQVRAAADFQAGATQRHEGPPPSKFWP